MTAHQNNEYFSQLKKKLVIFYWISFWKNTVCCVWNVTDSESESLLDPTVQHNMWIRIAIIKNYQP